MPDLSEVIETHLGNEDTGWNMGGLGAIAEFHHVEGDPPAIAPERFERYTSRGGIRMSLPEDMRPIAYETLSTKPNRWTQAIALCLPRERVAMTKRQSLCELGPDQHSLRPEDKGAILFDMGLGQRQVDFCIRTSDPALLAVLRSAQGQSLFAPGNPAMAAILAAHPHRVALTRLGRVEVFQKIGGPDTGGVSPEGPHTHVLPNLLRVNRTHPASTPIPTGWVPCAALHPCNPVFDRMGTDKDFDAAAFTAFQELLTRWGAPEYTAAKTAAWAALREGAPPESHAKPKTRLDRVGLRAAIRQWRRQMGDSSLALAWAATFDRGVTELEDEAPGH